MSSMTSKIDFAFIKFMVSDFEAIAQFYQRSLNLEVVRKIETPVCIELVMQLPDQTNGFCLILYKPLGDHAFDSCSLHGPLGFYVDNLDDAIDRCLRQGAVLEQGPFRAGGFRVAFLRDPESHALELLERVAV